MVQHGRGGGVPAVLCACTQGVPVGGGEGPTSKKHPMAGPKVQTEAGLDPSAFFPSFCHSELDVGLLCSKGASRTLKGARAQCPISAICRPARRAPQFPHQWDRGRLSFFTPQGQGPRRRAFSSALREMDNKVVKGSGRGGGGESPGLYGKAPSPPLPYKPRGPRPPPVPFPRSHPKAKGSEVKPSA